MNNMIKTVGQPRTDFDSVNYDDNSSNHFTSPSLLSKTQNVASSKSLYEEIFMADAYLCNVRSVRFCIIR